MIKRILDFFKNNWKKILLIVGIVIGVAIITTTTVVGIVNKDLFTEITYSKYNEYAEQERVNPNSHIELRYLRTHGSTEVAFGSKVDYSDSKYEVIEHYYVNPDTGAFETVEGSTKQYLSYAKKTLSTVNDDESYTYYKGMFGKFKYVTIDNDSTYSQTRYICMYNKYGKVIYYSYENWTQNTNSRGLTYYYYEKNEYFVTWSI